MNIIYKQGEPLISSRNRKAGNPNAAKVGGGQNQGAKSAAAALCGKLWATNNREPSDFPERVAIMIKILFPMNSERLPVLDIYEI